MLHDVLHGTADLYEVIKYHRERGTAMIPHVFKSVLYQLLVSCREAVGTAGGRPALAAGLGVLWAQFPAPSIFATTG